MNILLLSIVLYCLITPSLHCALFRVFIIVLHPTCPAPMSNLSSVLSPMEEGCVFLVSSHQLASTQVTAFPALIHSCSQGREPRTLQVSAHVLENEILCSIHTFQKRHSMREKRFNELNGQYGHAWEELGSSQSTEVARYWKK